MDFDVVWTVRFGSFFALAVVQVRNWKVFVCRLFSGFSWSGVVSIEVDLKRQRFREILAMK